jgi:ribosomal protein S18 acetylase RimI-like enzyme
MKDTISDVKIFEKKQKDLVELRILFLEVRRKTFLWTDISTLALLDFDEETEGEYILVARADNKIVGFISVWLADNFIHHLYVDIDYHNLGIGTKLLNRVIEKTGFPVGLKCIEKNKSAIEFYLKRGFTEKGKGLSEDEVYILLELQSQNGSVIL